MANYSISNANLSAIESNLGILARNINVIAQNVDVVSGQVQAVDSKVDFVTNEVNVLAEEFRAFVGESRRIAALADAKQTVVMLEQELAKEFGHYDTIRKHTVGILQATDVSVVRKETISTATEELMLSAPRYWLAPALIALSAWISDNKQLAEKALKEAMRRDDEKTSLLFCLISRRAGRLDGSLLWLERYFGMQDPAKMESRVIVVLDAFASGLFGTDAKGICASKIRGWLDELSARAGFIETQKQQWSTAICAKKVFINDTSFPYLKDNSSTWPELKEVLSWAETHENVYQYFSAIFNTPINNSVSVESKIDEILDNLVTNYDNEELPLRKELRRNHLIIEENGVIDRAMSRFGAEENAYQQYGDFSQHLTDAALSSEKTGALIATQKLAISLSKDWITDAYEDLTVKSRASIPVEIDVKVSNWIGKTRDGSNEAELQASLNSYVDNLKEEALAKIKWFSSKVVIAIIIGLIVGVIGIATVIVPILAAAGVAVFIFMERKKAKKTKELTSNQMEEFRNSAQVTLKATLAEVVDFRRLYAVKDADYTKVIDFLNQLSPEQYVSIIDSQKTRQIL